MIIDAQTLFSDAQSVTTSAVSTNVVDLAAAGRAAGEPIAVFVRMAETATATGDATLGVALQTSATEGFGSPVTLMESGAIPKTDLVAGAAVFQAHVPAGALRYLRLSYTVGTGPLTAGKVTAGLALDLQTA